MCERAPIATLIVRPDCGDELVFEKFNAAACDVCIKAARTKTGKSKCAGVLPERPGMHDAVIVPRAVDFGIRVLRLGVLHIYGVWVCLVRPACAP